MNWLALSEAGVGTGLVNALALTRGAGDGKRAKQHVATAVVVLAAIGVVSAIVALLVALAGPVALLLGLGARMDLTADARAMMAAAGLVVGLTLLANVVPQVLNALQEQYIGTYGAACASVAILVALWVAGRTGVGSVGFALILGLPPVLVNLALGADLLWRRHPELRFGARDVTASSFREVMATGGLAFLLQVGELAMVQSANVLIANRLGPGAVTPYAVTFSLLYAGMYFVNLLSQPLWAAYAEAWARGDVAWVRRRFRTTLRLVTVLGFVGLCGAGLLGRMIIRLWAGEAAVPSWPLLLSMCAFCLCWIVANCIGVLASGLGLFAKRGLVVTLTSMWFVVGGWLALPRWGVAALPCIGISVVAVQGAVAWCQARERLSRQA